MLLPDEGCGIQSGAPGYFGIARLENRSLKGAIFKDRLIKFELYLPLWM
jgi:hypothetical protein